MEGMEFVLYNKKEKSKQISYEITNISFQFDP